MTLGNYVLWRLENLRCLNLILNFDSKPALWVDSQFRSPFKIKKKKSNTRVLHAFPLVMLAYGSECRKGASQWCRDASTSWIPKLAKPWLKRTQSIIRVLWYAFEFFMKVKRLCTFLQLKKTIIADVSKMLCQYFFKISVGSDTLFCNYVCIHEKSCAIRQYL